MQTMDTNASSNESGSTLADLMIGAVAGAAAIWVMDRVDWFNFRHESDEARRRTEAVRPRGAPPAQVMVTKAAERLGAAPSQQQIQSASKVVHYMLGIVPAALYSVYQSRYPAISKGRGTLFGLGVFLLHDEGMNPLMGWSAKPTAYPWQAHARGVVAHLVFGAVTDALVRKLKGRRDASMHTAEDAGLADTAVASTTVTEVAVMSEDNDALVAPLQARPPQPSVSTGESLGTRTL
jgi:uncharacterized membrane protein YagU involved in acid resistance